VIDRSKFELAQHVEHTELPATDALAEDNHKLSVTFFFDDQAMDYGNQDEATYLWLGVIRTPMPGGYMETPITVSDELAEQIERLTSAVAEHKVLPLRSTEVIDRSNETPHERIVGCPCCCDDAELVTAPGPNEPTDEYICTSCGCNFTSDGTITFPCTSTEATDV
jgi:hypothetical protein